MTIGKRVRELRKHQGYTLEEFSERAGCSKSYAWEVENKPNARPSAEWAIRAAEALGVTVDYLICGGPIASANDEAFFSMYLSLPEKTKCHLHEIARILKGGA